MPLRGKTKKRGGTYLGEGAYGCTYKPAMKCKGEVQRQPNSISKLLLKTHTANNLKGKTLLETLDPEQKYFLYPNRVCEPNLSTMDPIENNLTKCRKYRSKQIASNLSDTDLLLMKNGGSDLIQVKLRPEDYYPFFRDLASLFEGLNLLKQNKIIHFDIKPENIVVQKRPDGSFHFRLIDFGFMTSVAEFDTSNKGLFLLNYFVWPYEVRYLAPVFTRASLTDANIDEFYQKSLSQYSKYFKSKLYFGATKPDFLTEFDAYKRPTKTAAQMLKKRENLLMAIDLYSFGVALARIFAHFVKQQYNVGTIEYSKAGLTPEAVAWNEEVAEKISKPFYKLVEWLTQPIWLSRNRVSFEELQEFYQTTILPEMALLFTPDKIAVGLRFPAPGGGKRKTRKSCRK